MVTDEPEVVRALRQSTSVGTVFIRNDSPIKDTSKDFGRDARGYVEQRVASSFERNRVFRGSFDFLVQIAYLGFVDFSTHAA